MFGSADIQLAIYEEREAEKRAEYNAQREEGRREIRDERDADELEDLVRQLG